MNGLNTAVSLKSNIVLCNKINIMIRHCKKLMENIFTFLENLLNQGNITPCLQSKRIDFFKNDIHVIKDGVLEQLFACVHRCHDVYVEIVLLFVGAEDLSRIISSAAGGGRESSDSIKS